MTAAILTFILSIVLIAWAWIILEEFKQEDWILIAGGVVLIAVLMFSLEATSPVDFIR